MRYVIVIEKAEGNFSACVPELPGCVATGANMEEIESQIREAIEFHLEGMREDGTPILPPASRAEYVDIAAYQRVQFGTLRSFDSSRRSTWTLADNSMIRSEQAGRTVSGQACIPHGDSPCPIAASA